MTDQLAINFAAAKRDDGIQRAAEHAGEEWTERAVEQVRRYAEHRSTFYVPYGSAPEFLAEYVRDWSEFWGFDKPPDSRAWGHVMRLAAKRGYIRKAGYLPAKSSNLSPKVAWVRA